MVSFFLTSIKRICLAAFVFAAALLLGQPVLAECVESDHGPLANKLDLPVYQWQDYSHEPKAVILAIHGLTMHGSVFDACARKLAANGAIVLAPDLRGYGAWLKDARGSQVDYQQSEKDILALASAIRQQYKGLPVFVVGESLGASMAIRLAAKEPELTDGLILCSPAIHMCCPPRALVDACKSLASRGHQFDTSAYIKQKFSEDSQITNGGINDPLVRKRLTVSVILETSRFISGTKRYISRIPAAVPVLVMQGDKDQIVKPSGASVLETHLKTTDKTIDRLPERGHILIETAYVHPDDLDTIVTWVDQECTHYNANHAHLAAGL